MSSDILILELLKVTECLSLIARLSHGFELKCRGENIDFQRPDLLEEVYDGFCSVCLFIQYPSVCHTACLPGVGVSLRKHNLNQVQEEKTIFYGVVSSFIGQTWLWGLLKGIVSQLLSSAQFALVTKTAESALDSVCMQRWDL